MSFRLHPSLNTIIPPKSMDASFLGSSFDSSPNSHDMECASFYDDTDHSSSGPYASLSQMREQILQTKLFLARTQLQSAREDLAVAQTGAQRSAVLIRQLQTQLQDKDARISQLSLELELMEAECQYHREFAAIPDWFSDTGPTITHSTTTDYPMLQSIQPEQETEVPVTDELQLYVHPIIFPTSLIPDLSPLQTLIEPDVSTESTKEDPDDASNHAGIYPCISTTSSPTPTKSCFHTLCFKTTPGIKNGLDHPPLDVQDSQHPYLDSCHNTEYRLLPSLLSSSSSSSSSTTTSNHSSPNSLASKWSSLRCWIHNSYNRRDKQRLVPKGTIPSSIFHTRRRNYDSASDMTILYPESDYEETIPSQQSSSSPNNCRNVFTIVMGHPRKEKYQLIPRKQVVTSKTTTATTTLLDLFNTSTLFISDDDEALIVTTQTQEENSNLEDVSKQGFIKRRKNTTCVDSKNTITPPSSSSSIQKRSVGIVEFVLEKQVNPDSHDVDSCHGMNVICNNIGTNETVPNKKPVGSKRKRDRKRYKYTRERLPLAPLIEEVDEPE